MPISQSLTVKGFSFIMGDRKPVCNGETLFVFLFLCPETRTAQTARIDLRREHLLFSSSREQPSSPKPLPPPLLQILLLGFFFPFLVPPFISIPPLPLPRPTFNPPLNPNPNSNPQSNHGHGDGNTTSVVDNNPNSSSDGNASSVVVHNNPDSSSHGNASSAVKQNVAQVGKPNLRSRKTKTHHKKPSKRPKKNNKKHRNFNASSATNAIDPLKAKTHTGKDLRSCDFYDGSWVVDDSPPAYLHGSSPFVEEAFNCFENGRVEDDFLRYRWQTRLDGKEMLDMLRGKRLAFVGDSLNRNMWESLVRHLYRNIIAQSSLSDHHS
ncbi:protein trichome birefringence-like [Macadamia integrifolia]|uniref:protein trichome birefringence-like n=1 Tax=Macadamia integrifolia TaxID=60698 RepID=UPI001C4ED6A6|nr:protein trichome birefringence-like [Macadamia integrifolia]